MASVEVYEDGTVQAINCNRLVAQSHNFFKGWKCLIPMESIFINCEGKIDMGSCGVMPHVGNLYDPNLQLDLPDEQNLKFFKENKILIGNFNSNQNLYSSYYFTCKKSSWNQHLATRKHINAINAIDNAINATEKYALENTDNICSNCGKTYTICAQ